MKTKYFILKRNDPDTLHFFKMEVGIDKAKKMHLKESEDYLLIETGRDGETEYINKIKTIFAAAIEMELKSISGFEVWDETGALTIIHFQGKIYTFEQWRNRDIKL